MREESDTKPAQDHASLETSSWGGASLGPMCLATGVVPIWFEILHSWTIEWIMEQELKPRQQVNFLYERVFL